MKNKLVTNQEMKEILKNESLNVRHRVYYVNEDRRKRSMKPKKSKYTLNQIGETLKEINGRLGRVETRLDRIEERLDYNNLKKLPR